MVETTVKIDGMSCQHCVATVKKAIEALDGINSADVSVGSAKVGYDDTKTDKGSIEKAITTAGYKVAG